MHYYLGIDISTTATKALLIDQTGHVAGAALSEYPFDTPRPLWSEQDAHLWWEGTIQSVRQVLSEANVDPVNVGGIGLTGQMHGLVLLDKAGKVLRPAILWNDQRTGAQCDDIRVRLGKRRLIDITGNDALTGFTAPKILWVQQHEPDIWDRTHDILLPKDFVRYKLTGDFAMDKADGAGTLLMDLKTRQWSQEVLGALDIPPGRLPRLYEGPEITGRLTDQAGSLTGLKADTPVVAGGGDQAAQAVGVGAVREGLVAMTLGTSGVVFASTSAPLIERHGRLHAFCHAIPGRWHLMGVMLSAAGSLRWYRDTFAPGMEFDQLLAPAGNVPVGAEGLLFLPYLTGERTPHPDPLARGAFVGLTVRHGMAHLTRAVLEGVAFGLRDSFEMMKQSGLGEIEQVRVSGGGARSSLWKQILADVLETELVTVNTTEGAAYGAALLAGVGLGQWENVDSACDAVVQVKARVSPEPEDSQKYGELHAFYRELYPQLKSTFQELAQSGG